MDMKTRVKIEKKEELCKIIGEMVSLDSYYPELGAPSVIGNMITMGCFDTKHPWDFLIALGIAMRLLADDLGIASIAAERAINRLRSRTIKALRKPTDWMQSAITPEVEERFRRVAGKPLPELRTAWWQKSKHEAQLRYVLKVFCCDTLLIGMPEDYLFSSILTMHDYQNMVASMERPPQDILERVTARIIEVEAKEANRRLSMAGSFAEVHANS